MDPFSRLLSFDPLTWQTLAAVVAVFAALGGLILFIVKLIRFFIGRSQITEKIVEKQDTSPSNSTINSSIAPVFNNNFTFPDALLEKLSVNQATNAPIPETVQASPNSATLVPSDQQPTSSRPSMSQSSPVAQAGGTAHVMPVAPANDTASPKEEEHIIEQTPKTGGLPVHLTKQRSMLRMALWCASVLAQEIRVYADKVRRPSQSDQPYQSFVRSHQALLSYLDSTREAVSLLNSAMNKLEKIPWADGDPRNIFFAQVDPMSGKSPGDVRAAFSKVHRLMIEAVRDMGYTVEQRVITATKSQFLQEGREVSQLTKARNPELEAIEVPDDELSDEDEE